MSNIDDAQWSRMMADLNFMLSTDNARAIFDRLYHAVRAYGFDNVVLGRANMARYELLEDNLFYFQHGMEEYSKIYRERGFQSSDPIALRILASHRPFRWKDAVVDLTPKQKEQVEIARKFNHNFGYAFPIISREGPIGFVSMGRATDFELSEMDFFCLELLTRHAYFSIENIYGKLVPPQKASFTPREVTVLTHVANGKTNWEVGQILGISEYSIRDYLKSLSKRLETSNRTHTVVKAIKLGLVVP